RVVGGRLIEFAVERGAADLEPACDFRHLTAIMRDRKTDDLVFHVVERPHFAGGGQHRKAAGSGKRSNRYITTRNHGGRRRWRNDQRFAVRQLAVRYGVAEDLREIRQAELVALAHDDGAIHRVLELADVAGPVELRE